MKRIIEIAVVMAVVAAVVGFLYTRKKAFDPKDYVVENARIGDITSSVSATGKLQAKVTVLVGTEVSGTIRQIMVDYNYPVKKGEVLLKLDQELFQAQVDQARANLMNAQAKLQEMESNRGMTSSGVVTSIDQAKANLAKAEADYKRDQILIKTGSTSQQELDTTRQTYTVDKSLYEQALAEKDKNAVLDAQIAGARASVGQARASLQTAETNLSKTVITSPMDGVVIDKAVEVGQTVAASFSTPNLLTIGDLSVMQVAVSIDEADVGQTKVGQKASFTVDAFPDHVFEGTLSQIYYSPVTVQNVVTYTGIVEVRNEKGLLRPGMTANVKIITGQKKNVLLIPSSALRVKLGSGKEGKAVKGLGHGGQTVWVMQKGGPKPVQVNTGLTDFTNVEVISGLKEGDPVVTDYLGAKSKPGVGSGPHGYMRM
jgi:HlyD family secretion protein